MEQHDWLAEQFEGYRAHLQSVAYRMLGSEIEADDAVQASWLRLSRSDAGSIENMGGWLTTVVARVCLDMLRSRRSRREESLDEEDVTEPIMSRDDGIDPEHEVLLADSVGLALLVVLDMLEPDERLAFVLHDLFAMPFDEIAPIIGRSSAAARQLASRARRRVRGVEAPAADMSRQREVVTAFLAASRSGDFDALMALLDPDVVFTADSSAIRLGATEKLTGAAGVAKNFQGRARAVQPALVNGVVGAMWATDGKPHFVFAFTFRDDKIAGITMMADPATLAELELAEFKD